MLSARKFLLYCRKKSVGWVWARKGWSAFVCPIERVKHIRAQHCDFSGDAVIIGGADELSEPDAAKVYKTLRDFMPWRKGPFDIFGISVDAEWRSERKWNRVLPELPDLRDKIVADIGCNNGYYMFRMARHDPKLVIGFEPYLQHYFAFKTLNTFAGIGNLAAELLGVEHMTLFPNCFDVVFLMGILYHRSSPVDVLRDIRAAMSPEGVLIVESQGIPGNESLWLFSRNTAMPRFPAPILCQPVPVLPTGCPGPVLLMWKYSIRTPCPARNSGKRNGWFLNRMRILLINPILPI